MKRQRYMNIYLFCTVFWLTISTSQAQCDAVFADDNILLASIGQKLYRSTDNGSTFEHVMLAGEDDVEIRTITKVNNTLIAGGINGSIRVFRSTDNGLTWIAANNGMPQINGVVSAVPVTSLTVGSRVFMGGTNFSEYSDDEGQTWNDIPTVPILTNALKYTDGKIWHTSYSQIRYSIDNGGTWTQITSPLFGGAAGVGFNKMGSKLIMLNQFSGAQAVKQSLDNGASWSTIGNLSIGLDMIEVGGDLYAASYDGFMKSTDEGQTWTNTCSSFQYYAYGGKMVVHNDIIWIASMNGLVKYQVSSETCEVVDVLGATNSIEDKLVNDIRLSPNPANTFTKISNLSDKSKITLLDLNGQLIDSFESSDNEEIVNLEDYKNGVYFLTVENKTTVYTEKIIVSH